MLVIRAQLDSTIVTTTDLGLPRIADSSVLLAAPRGYCAGVDRAVVTVEKALDLYGAPVYVRKQIVHNKHVVSDLEARGAIFVEELDEVPEGETVVFSAHGVAPSVHEQAAERHLKTIDATCPLVTKVHHEAKRFAGQDYDILLIGREPLAVTSSGLAGSTTWMRSGASPNVPSTSSCSAWPTRTIV
jgi:4-hydroxy-3-methylbut-2-enyl diphosphate reductase